MLNQVVNARNLGNFFTASCLFGIPGKLLIRVLFIAFLGISLQAQAQETPQKTNRKLTKGALQKLKAKGTKTDAATARSLFMTKLRQASPTKKSQAKALVAANAPLQLCLTLPDGNTVILTEDANSNYDRAFTSLGGEYYMYFNEGSWTLETGFFNFVNDYDNYTNPSTSSTPPTEGWVAAGEDGVISSGPITVVNGRCAGTRQTICVTLPDGFVVTLADGGPFNGAPDFYSRYLESEVLVGDFYLYRSMEGNTWELSNNNGYDTYTNSSTALTPPTDGWVAAGDQDAITGSITVALGACTATPAQLCVSFPDGERVTVLQVEPFFGAPGFVAILGENNGVGIFYGFFGEGWVMFRENESTQLFEFYTNPSTEKTVPLTGWVLDEDPFRSLPAKDKAAKAELTISTGACTDLPTLSASSLVVSGVLGAPNCSVDITGLGTGKSFVFTGPGNATPNNYVFSNVFRRNITNGNIRATGITQPGTYTLTVGGEPGQPVVTYTIEVTGTPCN